MDNDKIYRQCGDGWKSLIDPLIQRCYVVGATVDQIKEKYGTLRFYYTPPNAGWDDKLEKLVDDAEYASARMCEMCGAEGKLLVNKRGSWLKTLCPGCALDLGYKDKS
jgi:hypothetical protein